jgi:spheroidene monooxygenase
VTQVVSLSLYRFDGALARVWAFAMMGLARPAMARVPGIGFWKLCGSGTGEGFTPLPNLGVYAILARYRAKASENWTIYMSANSVRGAWAGQTPFEASAAGTTGPLAALTRATIKPGILARFWHRVPNISRVIGQDPNVMFKIGIGEVPWLHQVTFSIWPDAARMANFARTGPHADAIRAVRDEGWFREELYARFTLLSDEGSWGGSSPLNRPEAP